MHAAGLPSPWRGAWPNLVSFVLTIASIYFAGAITEMGPSGGLRLVLGLISILVAHEMGHYLACRIYGVNSTLPFFIPAPWAPIGPGFAWMPLRSGSRAHFPTGRSCSTSALPARSPGSWSRAA